ncbi:endolytic transglycosylase MltG [Elizabethkingia argentiflava]|uniref:Endolytic murein transglycosylase n=1 Tax=Elizabethkingia argenteiflava TaxID=2681556 RepID=A0A845PX03_9FLAO|nr:endolytic transglycosylase MltG [Elizabethkingia argenteiflava]NAW50987.1 endolytic transglycosylase MltG [Elizabethkingia argenteiflava]
MRNFFLITLFALIAIGGFFGWNYYQKNYQSNVKKPGFLLVPHEASFKQVIDSLSPYLRDIETFKQIADTKNLPLNIKAGRYEIKEGMDNTNLVNMIKMGLQTEESFRIKDFNDVYQMIGRVARKTEADSLSFVKAFNVIARQKGLNNAEDLKPYFFSDTYNFYWTVTPEEFFKRFENIYSDFWTPENITKERKLGLSRVQVYTLASIVQKESGGKPEEQKRIAGLYLNRYRKGMKLQSDPTIIYAITKESNFTKLIKRVYYKDLMVDSPYNTYLNIGLPPGPICVVNKTSIENVLDAEDNDYIFMVADPSRLGYHKFTHSAEEHIQNAKIYQDWLNSKEIK